MLKRLGWLAAAMACLCPLPAGAQSPDRPGAVERPECRTEGGLTLVCGILGGEDLVATLDGKTLIVTGRREDKGPSLLTGLSLATLKSTALYGQGVASNSRAEWGDPTCREDAGRFSPHGLSLLRRQDGREMLAAVQHGGRESVELFEVLQGSDGVRVEWRGCAIAPDGIVFNDLALFADGGFVATDYLSGNQTAIRDVYRWRRGAGFAKVPGAHGIRLNGILLSPAEDAVYLADTATSRVRRVDLRTGRATGEIEVASPDNISWSPQGTLLAASLDLSDMGAIRACIAASERNCPVKYRIVEIDPALTRSQVIHAGGSATMGLATVGLIAGQHLFVSSSIGDHVLRVDLAPPPRLAPSRSRRSVSHSDAKAN